MIRSTICAFLRLCVSQSTAATRRDGLFRQLTLPNRIEESVLDDFGEGRVDVTRPVQPELRFEKTALLERAAE